MGKQLGRGKGNGGDRSVEAEQEAAKIRARRVVLEDRGDQARRRASRGKEAARKHKADLDEELRARRAELQKREEGLAARERDVDKSRRESERRAAEIDKKDKSVAGKVAQADAAVAKAEAAQTEARGKLEAIAGLSEEDARKRLEDEVRAQALASAAVEIKKIEDEAHREAQLRPREDDRGD